MSSRPAGSTEFQILSQNKIKRKKKKATTQLKTQQCINNEVLMLHMLHTGNSDVLFLLFNPKLLEGMVRLPENMPYLRLTQGQEEGSDFLEYQHGQFACGHLEAAEQDESKAFDSVEDAAVGASLRLHPVAGAIGKELSCKNTFRV